MPHSAGNRRRYAFAWVHNARGEGVIFHRESEREFEPWTLPGGALEGAERDEVAIQHLCREQIGVDARVLRGAPPVNVGQGTHVDSLRLFVCEIGAAQPVVPEGLVLRWVLPGHLREYHFVESVQPLIAALIESSRPT